MTALFMLFWVDYIKSKTMENKSKQSIPATLSYFQSKPDVLPATYLAGTTSETISEECTLVIKTESNTNRSQPGKNLLTPNMITLT